MSIPNVEEALRIIENISLDKETHQKARQFLADLDKNEKARELVESLESNDSGIRWKAATMLGSMGKLSVSAVLKALMDPNRVCDPHLRQGVIHMIHVFRDRDLKHQLEPLIDHLEGPAADIATMWEAYRIFKEINPER
jgi:HEAT repeat protein